MTVVIGPVERCVENPQVTALEVLDAARALDGRFERLVALRFAAALAAGAYHGSTGQSARLVLNPEVCGPDVLCVVAQLMGLDNPPVE